MSLVDLVYPLRPGERVQYTGYFNYDLRERVGIFQSYHPKGWCLVHFEGDADPILCAWINIEPIEEEGGDE